jgi:sialic acid synthase SpsE
MVSKIREVEEMMQRGSGFVDVTAARNKLGRSLVSARLIPSGKIIEWDDLTLKSPGTGIPYRESLRLIGHVASRDIPCNATIRDEDVFEITQ